MNPSLTAEVPPEIREWHKLYEDLTGGPLKLDYLRYQHWQMFVKWHEPPYTHADLRAVVAYVRKTMQGHFRDGALKFSNLIVRPDYFEELLRIATVRKASRYDKDKASVLRATGREDKPPTADAKRVSLDLLAKTIIDMKHETGMKP